MDLYTIYIVLKCCYKRSIPPNYISPHDFNYHTKLCLKMQLIYYDKTLNKYFLTSQGLIRYNKDKFMGNI